MKRKVVQQGPSTLMVSLPMPWVKEIGIKKGDELEMEKQGKFLLLEGTKKPTDKEITINLLSDEEDYTWRNLQPAYILGYDTIVVKAISKKGVELVTRLATGNFIGFEVINQQGTMLTLRNIAVHVDEEFDELLKRTFILLEEMFSRIREYANKQNKEALAEVNALEKTNNRHTMFLKRVLHQGGAVKPLFSPAMFLVISKLEQLANNLKYYLQEIDKAKIAPAKDELLKTHSLFSEIYDFFYSPTPEKKTTIITKRIRTENLGHLLKKDSINGYYLMTTVHMMRDMFYARAFLDFDKNDKQ